MRFTIAEVAAITQGRFIVDPGNAQALATGLSWDSRTVEPGFVYAALAGERVDGIRFVSAAIKSGACIALVAADVTEEDKAAAQEAGAAIIAVEDVVRALGLLAKAWRFRLPARVIGVTGSVGKTTTRCLIAAVLSAGYKTHATKGNFNNELGMPHTILSAPEDTQMLVLEMGMDGKGQLEQLCAVGCPDMGVITNVGVCHLEHLGTRENIALAKAELIDALPEGATAFLQANGEYTDFICSSSRTAERGVKVVRFAGEASESDVYAANVAVDDQGCPSFVLHAGTVQANVKLSVRGVHNVDNACAAAAVGLACGLDLDVIAAALGVAEGEAGRQEIKHAASGAILFNDAYNANPDSMKASLRMLASFKTAGKKIAVLGDMGELGSATESGHVETGVAAVECGVDVLVCVGQLSALIKQGALDSGMDQGAIMQVAHAEEAIGVLREIMKPEDVVLVKASHFMGLDKVVEGVLSSC